MKKNLLYRVLAKAGIIRKMAARERIRIPRKALPPEVVAGFDWAESLRDPTGFYGKCVAFFDFKLHEPLKEHRRYFSAEQRGFGEDAFHVMWQMLVERYKPRKFLEIGVYRGQVISLVSLLQRELGIDGSVTGIGPFERVGDTASVSDYGFCKDWLQDTYANCARFGLPRPNLIKALSTEEIALETIRKSMWDMVYIDGNHDYEYVVEDWKNCAAQVPVGGVIVLDDAGLNSGFRAPLFASSGFVGPSRVANSAGDWNFKEVLQIGHNRAFERLG